MGALLLLALSFLFLLRRLLYERYMIFCFPNRSMESLNQLVMFMQEEWNKNVQQVRSSRHLLDTATVETDNRINTF
jgi:hypothetical protein